MSIEDRRCAFCESVIPEREGVVFTHRGWTIFHQGSCADTARLLDRVYDRSPRGRWATQREFKDALAATREWMRTAS